MTDMHFLPWLSLYIFLGLCVGSFLNVIIYRLPIMLLSSVPEDTIDKKTLIYLNVDLICVSLDPFVHIVIALCRLDIISPY